MISSLRNQIRSVQGASVRLALLRILGLGLVTVVWLGAQNELKATKIKKVAVVYRDLHGMHLLSEREISRVVALKAKRPPRGIMNREKVLRSQPSLVRADLSLGLDGILWVEVESSRPLMRVMPVGRPGYYLDDRGCGIPLSPGFAWPLPLVLGAVPSHWSQGKASSHAGLALALRSHLTLADDSILGQEVTQYVLSGVDSASLELQTRSGQRIWVGTSMGLVSKLNKLSLFYRWAPADSLPTRFHNINLIFKDQIVCR